MQLDVASSRDNVDHPAQEIPGPRAQGPTGPVRFDGGQEPELGHETVVLEGHFTVDAGWEGVLRQLIL